MSNGKGDTPRPRSDQMIDCTERGHTMLDAKRCCLRCGEYLPDERRKQLALGLRIASHRDALRDDIMRALDA